VSCDKGSRPEPGMIGYCMTKAGLDMFTKSAAMELAPFGIRVNAVAPGITDTNLYHYAGLAEAEFKDMKKRAAQNIPTHKVCKDFEIAKAIIFLTSEK
jgi:NAD(P)-dependent dehydrogenase (short-subunit alcohol dehydrogenase family)